MWLETLCAKKIKIDKKALFEQVCLSEWQSHERSVFQRLECNIRLSVFFNVKNLICLWRPLKVDSSGGGGEEWNKCNLHFLWIFEGESPLSAIKRISNIS